MNGVTEESSGGTIDGNHTDRQNRVSRNESRQTGRRASLLALVVRASRLASQHHDLSDIFTLCDIVHEVSSCT